MTTTTTREGNLMPFLTPTDPTDPMQRCPITGTAFVVEDEDGIGWGQADPEIHVAVELLNQLDDADLGRAFLTSMYKLGEPCPHQPGTVHARRRNHAEEATTR